MARAGGVVESSNNPIYGGIVEWRYGLVIDWRFNSPRSRMVVWSNRHDGKYHNDDTTMTIPTFNN